MKRKKGVGKTTTEWSIQEMISNENLNLHKVARSIFLIDWRKYGVHILERSCLAVKSCTQR